MALDVDATAISGVWWRHIPHGGDIWYRPPHPGDGRWQRGSVVEGLYLADSPETAWAEWYRMLAEYALRPNVHMPRDLWRFEIDMKQVANLSGSAQLARVGLPVPPPGRASWPPYQRIGEGVFAEGWPALIAPSAARPDAGLVVCVFREVDRVPGLTPVPPPEVHLEPPPPPRGLRT
jgi:hypothetical protein